MASCWYDPREDDPDAVAATCLLPDGHDGPHELTPRLAPPDTQGMGSERGEVVVVTSYDGDGGSILWGVAADMDAAEALVKTIYQSPPYVVEWERCDGGLRGDFAAVPGWSTKHTQVFEFESHGIFSGARPSVSPDAP